MTDVCESLQKLLPAIWLGMLIGVSFIATPVKFQAGSLSLPVALDVGRVTFHLFSRIEWIMAMLLVMALLAGGSPTRLKIVSCVLLSLILIEGIWLLPNLYARAHAMTMADDIKRPLTEADKREGFIRATGGFSGAKTRWADRAARDLNDAELAEALAYELGIFGGSCGPGMLHLTFQGAGLKIWIS